MIEIAFLCACLVLGLATQLTGLANDIRRRVWIAHFSLVIPAVVFYGFSTVAVDRALVMAIAAVILASWLTLGLGYVYAASVSEARDERGALVLAAGFGNAGFLGYPLAQLTFGNAGLALMALYGQLRFLVPDISISTAIARRHGRRRAFDDTPSGRRLLRHAPLTAAIIALLFRLLGADFSEAVEALGRAAGEAVGPVGFFLLGLSLSLEPLGHTSGELGRAVGAVAIRFAGAPISLFVCGLVFGAEIPSVFYLGAAMPCAFHLLILARLFDLRPPLMRLLVVGSTIPAVAVVVGAAALERWTD